MATYLDRILAAHRARARVDARPRRDLEAALTRAPAPRDFAAALHSPGLSVIAEVKRRSPSKGLLAPELDPRAVARAYEAGGAACLSVLTDAEFFGGSPDDLAAARSATALPVLRKDFTVSEADVLDARAMGADAVLLIVAALDDAELRAFADLAREIGLAALIECHDEDEVERALAAGADIVGVNQRDLVTFAVDTDRAIRVASAIPAGVVKVAESGIRTADDAARLAAAGYDAVLVGEHLVTSTDPASAVRALVAAPLAAPPVAG
ncbi:MAG TPA: indole-3-glycerol phosphate synthase TrpC [Acidimicrobiales bacterium]|nr:indole-3-glycerol phosphate synthase TrpC [Acidimicrobiales bacterium]